MSNLQVLVASIEETLSDRLANDQNLSTSDVQDLQRMDYLRQALKDAAAIASYLSDHVEWTSVHGPDADQLETIVDLRDSLSWLRHGSRTEPHQQDIWL